MNLLIFGLIIVIINCIISILLVNYLAKTVIETFKIHDDMDETLKNHICEIYDILALII